MSDEKCLEKILDYIEMRLRWRETENKNHHLIPFEIEEDHVKRLVKIARAAKKISDQHDHRSWCSRNHSYDGPCDCGMIELWEAFE